MNGEGDLPFGPTKCAECKTAPGVSINGQNHPICTRHRGDLDRMFRDYPERKAVWEGDSWDTREYGWVDAVRESRDDEGTPGDHDYRYMYQSPSHLQARGAISMQTALQLHRMKDRHAGKGLRVILAEPDWRLR